jgi:hypothetical protein
LLEGLHHFARRDDVSNQFVARGHAGPLQLNDHQRQAVDEADPIRPGVSVSLAPQVIQKLRPRFNARDWQMIPRTRAGEVEPVALGVIDLLQVCVVSYRLDAFLQGDDLVVAGHRGQGRFPDAAAVVDRTRSRTDFGLDAGADWPTSRTPDGVLARIVRV